MTATSVKERHPLAVSGVVYFACVLALGLPIMYGAYVVLSDVLVALELEWVVTSATGIGVVAVAFLVGMAVAGAVASRVVTRLS